MFWFLSHILVQKQKPSSAHDVATHYIPFLDSNDYFFVFYGISRYFISNLSHFTFASQGYNVALLLSGGGR